jgi:AcrR family transcriptional regulator
MTDISSKLNVAHGLIYRYFKSKKNILYAVIDELSVEYAEAAAQALLELNGSALDGLTMLLNYRPQTDNFAFLRFHIQLPMRSALNPSRKVANPHGLVARKRSSRNAPNAAHSSGRVACSPLQPGKWLNPHFPPGVCPHGNRLTLTESG